MKSFKSDNNSGVHPQVIQAIIDANVGDTVAYGDDKWTVEATQLIKEKFGGECEVLFTFNGTGANIICVSLGTKRFSSIICSSVSHINVDECGGPEVFTGCKLVDIASDNAKLTPTDIHTQLFGRGDPHHSQPNLVSITQGNELGMVYSVEEVRAICNYSHDNNLLVHMDGARIANACSSLGIGLKEMTADLGVDLLSFGGTKNGMMFGDAVIVFNQALRSEAKYLRKQASQLASKMRFISAQFISLLKDDLWLKNAAHANKMAKLLEGKITAVGYEVRYPVEANAVFIKMEIKKIEQIQKNRSLFYWWPIIESPLYGECRLMTSFDTTEKDIDQLVSAFESRLPA